MYVGNMKRSLAKPRLVLQMEELDLVTAMVNGDEAIYVYMLCIFIQPHQAFPKTQFSIHCAAPVKWINSQSLFCRGNILLYYTFSLKVAHAK